jgi:hypothetical protein
MSWNYYHAGWRGFLAIQRFLVHAAVHIGFAIERKLLIMLAIFEDENPIPTRKICG